VTPIGIFGAGAIGGYLGVRLAAGGAPVRMVARASMVAELGGLEAKDLEGEYAGGGPLEAAEDPAVLADVKICFVTVKARDSASAGRILGDVLPSDAVIVSLQNGLRNPAVMHEASGRRVLAGMVAFNVVKEGLRFRKLTSGPVAIEACEEARALAPVFDAAGELYEVREDIRAIQAGKLLLNLNNGVCAATGLRVLDSLLDRDSRMVFAECVREGRAAFKAAGMPVASFGPMTPALVEHGLRLPTFLFTRVARKMMTIDPEARSSTLQDLDRGKPTEIDELNGEIVRTANEVGTHAPANAFVVEQVHRLERGDGVPLTPQALRAGATRMPEHGR